MPGQRNQYRQGQGKGGQLPLDFSYGRIQPQAVEVEKAVLGALMIDKEAYLEVSELLRPESFYELRHQKIYDAVRQLSLNEKPVDVLTVTEQLNKNGVLEEVGGPGYIAELSSRVVTSANLEYHASIVAQKYLSRQLVSYSSTIGKKAFDETCDPKDVIDEAESILFEIAQTNVKKDYVHVSPLVKEASEMMMAASKNDGDVTGISTGYKRLDDLTSGWQKSDLVIIAGRPAMGKTAFALSMAKNIAADQKIPMAFFSLEMSGVQLVNRLIANTCEIEGKKILNGSLNEEEWDRFDKRIQHLIDAPLYIDDTPGLSVFELRTKAMRLVREHQIKLIMVDYLQLMHATGNYGTNRALEIGDISRQLKETAKELHIPIVALAQLNRNVMTRLGNSMGRPVLSDLKDSGSIEQDADMVLFINRPAKLGLSEMDESYAELIIEKNRAGEAAIIQLHFNGSLVKFSEDHESLADYAAKPIPSAANSPSPVDITPTPGYAPYDFDQQQEM